MSIRHHVGRHGKKGARHKSARKRAKAGHAKRVKKGVASHPRKKKR